MSAFCSIPAVHVSECTNSDHWISALVTPGAYLFVNEDDEIAEPGQEAALWFRSPAGEGHGRCPLGQGGWSWNGDRERPTLSPSVWFNKGEPRRGEWHGWLRDGEWRGC